MNKNSRWLSIASFVAVMGGLVLAVIFYKLFPARVPIHWNIVGIPDKYASRVVGAFILPLINTLVYLMFILIPKIYPRQEKFKEFASTYTLFQFIIVTFFLIIYIMTGLVILGFSIPISTVVPMCVGILFSVMGFYLNKVKTNWFLGIRTPWTLSDDTVWDKTHQFGGKLFVIGGIAMIISALLPLPYNVAGFIAVLILIGIVPVVYSYFIYQSLHRLG